MVDLATWQSSAAWASVNSSSGIGIKLVHALVQVVQIRVRALVLALVRGIDMP